jgi:hypothetical protein
MHALEPFLPDILHTPDHSDADLAREFEALSLVQTHLRGFLLGTVDLDSFENVLEFTGICPIEYWDVVEENVDAIVEERINVELECVESLLLLPGRDF